MLFQSFDEAWDWFAGGGELVPMSESRQRFLGGRAQFLAFQAPVGEMPVADEIVALQDELEAAPGLQLMPRDMLHVSIRGVGFQVITKVRPDDVLRQDVAKIGEGAAKLLRDEPPVHARAGPLNVFPDALILQVEDSGALARLRSHLDAVGVPDAFTEDAAHYLPHITVATYVDPEPAARVLREMLPALRERPPIDLAIRRVELSRWWFTGEDPEEEPERDVLRTYLLRGGSRDPRPATAG